MKMAIEFSIGDVLLSTNVLERVVLIDAASTYMYYKCLNQLYSRLYMN